MNETIYDKKKYTALLVKMQLREAVRYLEGFTDKKELVQRYYDVFEKREYTYPDTTEGMKKMLSLYYDYYVAVFWNGQKGQEDTVTKAETELLDAASMQYNLNRDDLSMEKMEEYLEAAAKQEGYHFLGGETAGVYGPYIWKTSEPAVYQIELPERSYELTVVMMDEFISRSWLDFLSFGKSGTGGWSNGDGQLYCVKKPYENIMEEPDFLISYLKHEAQHAVDLLEYGRLISPADLEYRAKLIELMYYTDLTIWKDFVKEADSTDKSNSHSYASYVLVTGISRKTFGRDQAASMDEWEGKLDLIRKYAKELLAEHTRAAEPLKGGSISLITGEDFI